MTAMTRAGWAGRWLILWIGVSVAVTVSVSLAWGHSMEATLNELRGTVNFIERGSEQEKVVALTFDDGPHPEYTYRILRILNFYQAKATFFVVGTEVEKYPQWVKMANQLGMEIGSHTYEHFRLSLLSEEEARYQIEQNQQLIRSLVGYEPLFLRPPGGRVNGQVGRLAAEYGLVIAWWSYNSNDLSDRTADEIYQSVVDSVEPGAIILFHDGSEETVKALPRIIEELRRRGYRLVTMSELYRTLPGADQSLLTQKGILSRPQTELASYGP